MTKIKVNKEDYRKMKLAVETKDFSLLKDMNYEPGTNADSIRDAIEGNAYLGISLEDTLGPFDLVDGPTEFITQEEIDALLNS